MMAIVRKLHNVAKHKLPSRSYTRLLFRKCMFICKKKV